MFSRSTQEAIKVAIAISVSIGLAIFFQWEKPYWAGITVFVLSITETYGHSVQQSRNRILGTLLGISVGVTLVSLFSQDRLMFLTLITLYLGFCMVFYNHLKFGYAFKISVPVCFIVASIGGFDSVTIFNLVVLRIQETILGVTVFSLVFRFIWPHTTEEVFFSGYKELKRRLVHLDQHPESFTGEKLVTELAVCKQQAQKLHEILSLPLSYSHRLQYEYDLWQRRVMILVIFIDYQLQQLNDDNSNIYSDAIRSDNTYLTSLGLADILERTEVSELDDASAHYFSLVESRYTSIEKHIKQAYREVTFSKPNFVRTLKGMSMFVSGLLMWIHLPIPMGPMFPMVMGIFACMLPSLPDVMMKHAFYGVILFGAVYTAEYVLIMPTLSEIWQLCGLYFINTIVLWKVFSSPKHVVYRLLGGNLMMVMTMGALNLTPVYDVTTSISMIVCVMLALLVARFFTDLYKPLLR
ncbi:FUSC family protein [Vibrio astriarenae]